MKDKPILKLYSVSGRLNNDNNYKDYMYVVAHDFNEARELALNSFSKIVSINLIALTEQDNEDETPLVITSMRN